MNLKKVSISILTLTLLVGTFTGCQKAVDQGTPQPTQAAQAKTSITINGSTSVQPLAEELAKAYKAKNPNVTIDIQAGGSGVGIKSAMDGVVDIGMSSRDLKPEEKTLKEFKIAIDGVAVILNPANGVTNLTADQIKKIYTGEVKNWKEVGGNDAAITVVTREEGSGTRGAFIELTGIEVKEGDKKVDKTVGAAITQGSTGAVITTVVGDPNAIGYASYGAVKSKTEIKMISVDGNACTEENIYSSAYKISRPFLMLTKDEPTGLAKAFVDFILSPEGQEVVASKHFLKAVK